MSAYYQGWVVAWSRQDVGDYMRKVWLRLAFCARYGAQPLDILIDMDTGDLNSFAEALAGIVKEENKPSATGR